jgi:hypothetical protein
VDEAGWLGRRVSRRAVLKAAGPLAVGVPAVAAGVVAALVTRRPVRLPSKKKGQVLTAGDWNGVIDRLNELAEDRPRG